MFAPFTFLTNLASQVLLVSAAPQHLLDVNTVHRHNLYFDVQAHRGGRGNTIENTLPSFAWSLIDGSSTIELDNGITKDGHVVVWHDEELVREKCRDTQPVTPQDPDYPYIGKFIANLTLAQIRTLDCGSQRQDGYPMQMTYPGTRVSTLQEVFDFVECADPGHQVLWNIESKIDPEYPNKTMGVDVFVSQQHKVFGASPYKDAITYQSFDWRTLVAMKELDPSITTSALVDDETTFIPNNGTSVWLAGLRLDSFPGPSLFEQVAQAAHSIRADILSPSASASESPVPDPLMSGYIGFTSKKMIDAAHNLGLKVKPWTVNRMNMVEQLLDWKVDGIITDYPNVVRRIASNRGLPVAPKFPKQRVLSCLAEHLSRQQHGVLST